MESRRGAIQRNLRAIHARIAAAAARAGRAPEEVRRIPINKYVDADLIRILAELGCSDVGENRVDVASAKRDELPDLPLRWHMVGNLQRRKAGAALDVFDTIDAVDRVALAEAINQRAEERGKVVPVLLELNVSGESTKHGFSPLDLESAYETLQAFHHLKVEGLMTMAPFVDDPEETRPVFRQMREWGARLGLRELSMGMSNDFEVAVEEGATQVRIGTALFE